MSTKPKLDEISYKILTIANIVMLLTILLHDGDHVRQAIHWHYTFTGFLLALNCIVYMPNLIALLLTRQRRYSGAIVTCIGGFNTAYSFAKIHLFGSPIKVWGIWNDSFFKLGADNLSWGILWFTVFIGAAVFFAGAYSLGRLNKD